MENRGKSDKRKPALKRTESSDKEDNKENSHTDERRGKSREQIDELRREVSGEKESYDEKRQRKESANSKVLSLGEAKNSFLNENDEKPIREIKGRERTERNDGRSKRDSGEVKQRRTRKDAGSDRPNRDSNDRGERRSRDSYDRTPRRENSDSDRPRRDNNDKGERRTRDSYDRTPRRENSDSDRPRRDSNDRGERRTRDSYDRTPRRENSDSDRPRRDNNDRGERRTRDSYDRTPRRENSDSDRPRRDNNDRGERRTRDSYDRTPRRENSDSDRPRRDNNDRGERRTRDSYDRTPRRDNSSSDRPRRDNNDRGERRSGDSYNRTPRRENSSSDRPNRGSKDRGDRRTRDSSEKPSGRDGSPGRYDSNDKGRSSRYRNEKKEHPDRFKKRPSKNDDSVRLNKFIANAGICSRREADELILNGAIKVNGVIVTELGVKIGYDDKVQYGDQTLSGEKKRYILLNKPKGYITTVDDPEGRKTVMMLIDNACRERVYPVGRLDRNTTGLLLFTNDGELAKKLTHPKHGVTKIYHVELDKALTKTDMIKIKEGIDIEGNTIQIDALEYADEGKNKKTLGIEIHSGQNRVVRKIFEGLGYQVAKLDRVFFAGLTKKELPRGHWRFLTEAEVNILRRIH